MQTQTPIDQFNDMLKINSIVVNDRETLVRLFDNIIELFTQIPKAKLKAAVKAATKPPAAAKPPAPKPPAVKKLAVVGPADAGVCPLESDLSQPVVRGRGRPRKSASVSADVGVDTVAVQTPVGEAEKKKRGRPKKDKSVTNSSNEDEDALIAQMITDAKNTKINDALNEETESDSTVSVSPAPNHHHVSQTLLPVENDVQDQDAKQAAKAVKEPKKPKAKAVKEPKAAKAVNEPKEPKAKAVKEPKEPKAKAVKEPKANESKATAAQATAAQVTVSAINIVASATSAAPVRENKAHSDGKFYLMPNYPRSSFTYSGKTYLRTENDNVYDNLTLELIGVWDHLNHEIITSFDDDDENELWMSDEE